MDYANVAKKILQRVGGKENRDQPCTLYDQAKIHAERRVHCGRRGSEKDKRCYGVMKKAGQYQIIIEMTWPMSLQS